MKQPGETKDSENYLNNLEGIDTMPHINSQDNSLTDIGGYDGYLHPRESKEGFERNLKQPFKYNFYNGANSENIYVNVKQLACIQKRKLKRDYLDTLMIQPKNTYLHESRHRHAMKRLRAPSGRFLTKEETEEFLRNQENENSEEQK